MSELSPEDLGNFNDHLSALADDAGLELDDADRMRLFQLSQEGGFNPEATEAAFNDLYGDVDWDDDDDSEPVTREDFEAWAQERDEAEQQREAERSRGLSSTGMQRLATDTAADAKRLAAKLGRPLLKREQDAIAERVLEQATRYNEIDVEAAAAGAKSYDDMSSDEINDHMVQRARDLEGPPEVDESRAYDLDNRKDWEDYAVQKLSGAEFDDVFSPEPDVEPVQRLHIDDGG